MKAPTSRTLSTARELNTRVLENSLRMSVLESLAGTQETTVGFDGSLSGTCEYRRKFHGNENKQDVEPWRVLGSTEMKTQSEFQSGIHMDIVYKRENILIEPG